MPKLLGKDVGEVGYGMMGKPAHLHIVCPGSGVDIFDRSHMAPNPAFARTEPQNHAHCAQDWIKQLERRQAIIHFIDYTSHINMSNR
jgi:6-phosphogluconate dehydrogenase